MFILTASATDEDIVRTYDLGASSFITKPITFADLIRTMETVTDCRPQFGSLPWE